MPKVGRYILLLKPEDNTIVLLSLSYIALIEEMNPPPDRGFVTGK
ncbi:MULTISPECIES: hypothetical protein [unclassified Chitinophaga]|nr:MULTISPECIES: hypothetical protein [unclassified Chitinophaga]WPV68011.1 hypothetical protein QQL36_04630 [Chitinophaga sp. LS1]